MSQWSEDSAVLRAFRDPLVVARESLRPLETTRVQAQMSHKPNLQLINWENGPLTGQKNAGADLQSGPARIEQLGHWLPLSGPLCVVARDSVIVARSCRFELEVPAPAVDGEGEDVEDTRRSDARRHVS
jgi:hypothetical protein